jgi:hypothetical protein
VQFLAFRDVLPLTATSPSPYRAMSCAVAFCGAKALLILDVQSNDKAEGSNTQDRYP